MVPRDLIDVAAVQGGNLLQAQPEGTAGPPRHRFAKGAPFLLNGFALGIPYLGDTAAKPPSTSARTWTC